MKPLSKYALAAGLAIFILMGAAPAKALTWNMSVDAVNDAGEDPGQNVYAQFIFPGSPKPPSLIDTSKDPFLTRPLTAQVYYNFATSQGFPYWNLQSAGNVWSSDKIVGDSITGLAPGTYRITALGGGYQYDSFGWDSQDAYRWWWELHIRASYGGNAYDDILGSTQSESTEAGLAQYLGTYRDINLPMGGDLYFWIYDTNSVDNYGRLQFEVTPVIPETPGFLLTAAGLLLLAWFGRRWSPDQDLAGARKIRSIR